MARLAEHSKAWVALVMAILVILTQIFESSVGGLSTEAVTIILVLLEALLVWMVPNHPSQSV